jgi:hypothetical protein
MFAHRTVVRSRIVTVILLVNLRNRSPSRGPGFLLTAGSGSRNLAFIVQAFVQRTVPTGRRHRLLYQGQILPSRTLGCSSKTSPNSMCPPDRNPSHKLWRRRDVLKTLGATAIAGPLALHTTSAKGATAKVIKIGHVSPQTGALAPFAEADPFILAQVRGALAKGLSNGGVSHQVEIISKDSQSKTNRAAEVAADLILKEKVDLLVASSTPETTNPVADQAEANEVPCITSITPWQPYFFGRHGTPDKGFTWTYHFFWGLKTSLLRSSLFGNRSRQTKSSAHFSRMMEMETPGATPKWVSRRSCRKPATS